MVSCLLVSAYGLIRCSYVCRADIKKDGYKHFCPHFRENREYAVMHLGGT